MSNSTPNTPKTIAEKEKETLLFWQENNIFEKSIEMPANAEARGDFSFYDGPPFATGLPHYGHILAGTIKDAIPRYQTMQGKSVRRVWGWDCHGLPIENLIEKKLGLASKKDIEDFGIDKFNKDAYESVLQYEAEWKDVIPRLGRWVDMEHPYKTMDATYTESIWWAWKTLYEKGLAYEGNKMMHICPRCETPLAQSEVGLEYHDVTDLSVTTRFELIDEPRTFILAWTTTPWTLPGNSALAVNKDIEYVKVRRFQSEEDKKSYTGKVYDELFYVMSKKFFIENFIKLSTKEKAEDPHEGELYIRPEYVVEADVTFELVGMFKGEKLLGKKYLPPFKYFYDLPDADKENGWRVWHADFITEDAGTGIAHEAPAFGAEDMELAKANNIPVIKHVKMDGTFVDAVSDFAGMKVKKVGDTMSADIEIIRWLAKGRLIFEKHKIIHSYPLCWRCKTPLLNYATSSWFVDVPQIKEKLISENQNIGWVPSHTRDGRFGKWLEGAREWAVSRSRYWGAPLPVWKSEDGDVKVVGSLKELAELSTSKPKNTYFAIRHGEAVSNITRLLDSVGDPENRLTETGKEQAKHAGHFAKEQGIEIIIHSPFLRTAETANIVKELSGAESMSDERLREFNTGEFSGKSVDDFHVFQRAELTNLDTKVPGGESHRDIMNRMMSVIHDCEKKYEGKKILLVTHGAPLWMLQAAASLRTQEEIIQDMMMHEDTSPAHAHIVPVQPLLVPRDETGAINLHRPYIDEVELSIDGKIYKRIGDVFDCWFESGSMPFASVHYPFENKEIFDKNYPADFIAEGVDQTRGWFYSLINLGVGLFDKAPYKHVIVNGLIMAETGAKLSKSEKNYTDPMILVEKYGGDSLRYALLSSPAVKGENLLLSDDSIGDVYKKLISRLENVVQLYEMNKPASVEAKSSSDDVLDRWMISRVHELVRDSTTGYEEYKLDEATRGIADIIDDISVWYTRRSRERLKGDAGIEDQVRAYETLTCVLQTLAKVVAPVMPFIAERVYQQTGGTRESVHLESWPQGGSVDEKVIADMKDVRAAVSLGLMKRTEEKINVKQPLLSVTLKKSVDATYFDLIKDELNVKEVLINESQEAEVSLNVTMTDELVKEGDVRKLIRAVQDMRKEKGLTPGDSIVLKLSSKDKLGDLSLLMTTCRVTDIQEDSSLTENKVDVSSGNLYFELSKI